MSAGHGEPPCDICSDEQIKSTKLDEGRSLLKAFTDPHGSQTAWDAEQTSASLPQILQTHLVKTLILVPGSLDNAHNIPPVSMQNAALGQSVCVSVSVCGTLECTSNPMCTSSMNNWQEHCQYVSRLTCGSSSLTFFWDISPLPSSFTHINTLGHKKSPSLSSSS